MSRLRGHGFGWWRLFVSVAIVAAVSATGEMPAHADPTLIGWTAQADANPFDIVIDNASGLGGSHPLVEADLPEDSSDFETGPFGHGLASIFWPGATLGNAGSLTGELGLPAALASLLGKLNDPVRAETFYPEGPATSSFPAGSPGTIFEATSHADGNGTSAKAGLTDVSSALFQIKGVQGSTTATASSQAQATATGSFASLSLLGGLIQIGATTSTVSVSSDGVNPSGTGVTHIGAITIAGHSVTIGSDGVVLGPAQTNLLGLLLTPPTAVVNQLLALLNFKVTVLPQTETSQAPAEEINSGGLQISFALPPTGQLSLNCSSLPGALAQLGILCHLPDELEGLKVTVTIAQVTATAIATPPFTNPPPSGGSSSPGTSPATSPPASAPATVATSYPSGPSIAGPTGASSPASSGNLPSLGTVPTTTRPAAPGASILPISLTSPVKAGLLGSLLALAVLVGVGLSRMGRVLEEPPPTPCSLEEQP